MPRTAKNPTTEAARRGENDWIQTFTGKAFYPLDPRPADVNITDIAHALSMKCRFNGHCREFYSVAQHSVLVSDWFPARSTNHRLLGLLHDAAEAYLPDVCRPIKGRVFVAPADPGNVLANSFRDVESRLLAVILRKFGLRGWNADCDAIKLADDIALATEARDLMGPPPKAWQPLPDPLPDVIEPLTPFRAETLFLDRFMAINDLVKAEVDAA